MIGWEGRILEKRFQLAKKGEKNDLRDFCAPIKPCHEGFGNGGFDVMINGSREVKSSGANIAKKSLKIRDNCIHSSLFTEFTYTHYKNLKKRFNLVYICLKKFTC